MRRGRVRKTVQNLLLVLLLLTAAWLAAGRPLPLRMEYRRAERAYFMEKKEILWQEGDRLLSRDGENLYLFQKTGFFVPVSNGSILTFPLENGVGYAMAADAGEQPLTFYAYAGGAAAVRLRYALTQEGETEPAYLYELTADTGENGVFCLPLKLASDNGRSYQADEEAAATDIYEAYQGYRISTDYALTITFYDADGSVMAVCEKRGGVSYED